MVIDENETFKRFGYHSTDWAQESCKKVVAVCDGCGLVREVQKRFSNKMCLKCACNTPERAEMLSRTHKGKVVSEEQKHKQHEKMSGRTQSKAHIKKRAASISASWTDERKEVHRQSMMGDKNHNYGKSKSPETLEKMIEAANNRPPMTDTHKEAIRSGNLGVKRSDETRANQSKSWTEQRRRESSMIRQQCDNIADWEGYSRDQKYCHKFNESLRNNVRDKYRNRCFLCGTVTNKNVGKDKKPRQLAVHHIDMDKESGCNGNGLHLIPLCMTCHPPAHTPLWTARIQYLLQHVW